RPWPTTNHPRRAAISSFGISGTNAHAIIEQPTEPAERSGAHGRDHDGPVVLPLSAHSPEALAAQAERLAAHLTARPGRLAATAGALARGRAALEHRAAVVLGGPGEEAEAVRVLRALAGGEEHAALVRGSAAGAVRTAFVFSGQGSQRAGMGRELYAAEPEFAAAFDAACAALDPHLERPLREVVLSGDDTLIHRTAYTQPALFALETALFHLLDHHGIRP
ncbi:MULTISPECIES: acyltransferase domain-containing protein, partial [Streptomyces]|uniref:acyltransferase domain-containing protein n=2 Tax=Streptomyces TaxID=1883 RepID=UPI00056D42CA